MKINRPAAITLGTIGLLGGAATVLSPIIDDKTMTHQEYQQLQQQRQMDHLADAEEMSKDRMRDEADDGLNTENERKNTPVEPRPKIKLRFP